MIQMSQRAVMEDYRKTDDNHPCPACGGPMAEVDRVIENGLCWIWFTCHREDCDGQWLSKTRADLI